MQEKVRYGTLKIPYTTDDLIDQYNCGELNSATFDKETAQVGLTQIKLNVKI